LVKQHLNRIIKNIYRRRGGEVRLAREGKLRAKEIDQEK
jgi:hypothetical protein